MSEPTAPQDPSAPRADDGAYVFHAVGKALTWDYIRAGFAIFVVAGVLGVMEPWTIAWFVMGALLLALLGYLLNTIYRHGLRIEMSDKGVTSGWRNPLDPSGPVLLFRKELAWEGLADLHMRYFSRKREDGNEGWLMLRLKGASPAGTPVTITFDGAHEGFSPVLSFAWEQARRKGLALDDTTVANLEALGFLKTEPSPWTS
jgi:hypothetical protein